MLWVHRDNVPEILVGTGLPDSNKERARSRRDSDAGFAGSWWANKI